MTDTHVIIAGDSNALGYLNTGTAPYAPTAQVQIWALQPDGGHQWNYMRPGINTGTPTNPADWGPEVGYANAWLSQHAGDGSYLWIVKNEQTVKGSTTLAVEWDPAHGTMFARTTEAAGAAMHNLDGSRFAFDHYDAALVVLGENDAVVPAYAAAYASNLAVFDAAARAQWGARQLVETRIEDTMGDAASNLVVRQAQWIDDQADPNMTSFKTIGFGQAPDHVHYDAAGQLAVGQGFFSSEFG